MSAVSCEDILSTGKDNPQPKFHASRNDNSHYSRIGTLRSASSCANVRYVGDSRSKVTENEFIANFVCRHLASHAEAKQLITLKEEGARFILRLNDLARINYIHRDFQHKADGTLNRIFKKILRKKSRKTQDKVENLMAQLEREGSLELVRSKTKYDDNSILEYKVKDDVLWHLLSMKYSVQKNVEQDSKHSAAMGGANIPPCLPGRIRRARVITHKDHEYYSKYKRGGSGGSSSETKDKPRFWQWNKRSRSHQQKFIQLLQHAESHPSDIKQITGVRVSFLDKFCIGIGSDGTRVYVGLGNDGVEKAVKRMHRDSCSGLAKHERCVLSGGEKGNSSNIVNYWALDEKSDKEYVFLILDLCEETLEDFVNRADLEHLLKIAPHVIRHILMGLADLHRYPISIVHRDLKPSNILQDVDGKWLLADFGISRIMETGAGTVLTKPRGTKDWMSVEACQCNGQVDDSKIRCKKESDIQVAGMVAFYIVTKGGHPFGEERHRLDNLLKGNPVDLDKVEDISTKDLITWMLSHNPRERPSAEEALKHPYLQSEEEKFEMLCSVGNQTEIKREDSRSDVVRMLNSNPDNWKALMERRYLKFLCNGKRYNSSWTSCLRLIRNVNQHWNDHHRPRPNIFDLIGDPQQYFLQLFPNLPVQVHKIIRTSDWRKRPELSKYFAQMKITYV